MAMTKRVGLAAVLLAGLGSMVGTFAAGPTARDTAAIVKDMEAANEQVRDVCPSVGDLADAKFRAEQGKIVLPAMRKSADLLAELAASQTGDAKAAALTKRLQYLAFMTALGDDASKKELETIAADAKSELAVPAASMLALGEWWADSEDAAAQGKVLDAVTALAHANPASDDVAGNLMIMANCGAATTDLRDRARDTIKTCLTGPEAQKINEALAALEDQQKMAGDAEKAQQDALGKPFALKGRTSSDGQFDSATLKGKVVLIDFWATWCGPCREELPNVKAAYTKYHDQGFEIVGVSCDMADEGLNDFTKDNDMPWVQLREKSQDSAQNEWHPLAKQYGVLGIPTMFLVDKKGVLRYVDARENLADKIAKLLAEPDGPATQPAQ